MKKLCLCLFVFMLMLICSCAMAEETQIILLAQRYWDVRVRDVEERVDLDVFVDGDMYTLYSGWIENYEELKAQFGGEPAWSFVQDDLDSIQLDTFLSYDRFQISQSWNTVYLVGDVHCTMTCTWGDLSKEVDIYLHIKEPEMGIPQRIILAPSEIIVKVNERFDEPQVRTNITGWKLEGYSPEWQMQSESTGYFDHVHWDADAQKFYADKPGQYVVQIIWNCANYQFSEIYTIIVLNEDGSMPPMDISMQDPWVQVYPYYLEGDDTSVTSSSAIIFNYDELQRYYGFEPTVTLTKLSGPDDVTFEVQEKISTYIDGSGTITLSMVGKPEKEGVSRFRMDIAWGESRASAEFDLTVESLKAGVPTLTEMPALVEVEVGKEFTISIPSFLPEGWTGNYNEQLTDICRNIPSAIERLADVDNHYVFKALQPGTYEFSIGRGLMNTNFYIEQKIRVNVINPDGILTDDMVQTYKQPLLLQKGEAFNLHYRVTDPAAVEEISWFSSGGVVSVSGNRITALSNGTDTLTLTVKGKNGQVVTKDIQVKVKDLNMIQLPSKLKTVDEEAFAGISTDRLIIDDQLESFDITAFAYTDNIGAVYFAADDPDITMSLIYHLTFYKTAIPIICPEGSYLQEVLEQSDYLFLTY